MILLVCYTSPAALIKYLEEHGIEQKEHMKTIKIIAAYVPHDIDRVEQELKAVPGVMKIIRNSDHHS